MKIETTAMDDLWIGMVTVAVVYMVMRTVSTLEKMSKKADAFVSHIGAEVESASAKLSKEARWIIQGLERSSGGVKESLLSQVQSVELQCYRSKNGIAFGVGPRTQKKKHHKRSHAAPLIEDQSESRALQKPQQHHSTVSLHRCIDRVLKNKHWCKWPLSLGHHQHNHRHFQAVESTTTTALAAH